MSKASEWAAECARVKHATPKRMPVLVEKDNDKALGASVAEDGRCVITYGASTIWLQEPTAVALARWILDTFGEPSV